MSTISIKAVLDEEEPVVIGEFEPEHVRAVLELMGAYPFEHPDGRICFYEAARFCFGANGDRPHFEVLARSEGDVKNLFALEQAAPDLLASLQELVNSPNAKQNAAWDRARAAIAKALGQELKP